tara:strand:- start:177 stop:425 length:249 start_codon:yes stop_codon:yes gene_type:complete
MKLDKIEVVTEYKHLQIREITDSGGYHRRVITPTMDISGEVQEIKDMAEEFWTDKIKTAWEKIVNDELLRVAEFETARESKE